MNLEKARAIVERSRKAQGLPERVTDAVTLSRVAAAFLQFEGNAMEEAA